ncbi:MAG: shikimate kinase [Bacteroidota bacterium]
MQIFLIGFMGSGKSTVGKKLANKLNYGFLDVDEMIQKGEDTAIEEIFQNMGEAYFRQLENKYLRSLPENSGNYVIATGGGLPCHDGNMEYMNQRGLTVYLKMNTGQLFYRLKHAKKSRPLLQNKTEDEIVEYIKKKLGEREPFYNQANIVFDAFNLKITELAEQINQQFV